MIDKRLTEYLDRHLRCDLAGLRAADSVRNGKNAVLGQFQERIFVLRTLFTQAPVAYGGRRELINYGHQLSSEPPQERYLRTF